GSPPAFALQAHRFTGARNPSGAASGLFDFDEISDVAVAAGDAVEIFINVGRPLPLGAPRLVLNGDPAIVLTVGDEYVDPGASAFDDVDGNLTSAIVVTNPVDAKTIGSYVVTYEVEDSSGNKTTATRTVEVQARTAVGGGGGGAAGLDVLARLCFSLAALRRLPPEAGPGAQSPARAPSALRSSERRLARQVRPIAHDLRLRAIDERVSALHQLLRRLGSDRLDQRRRTVELLPPLHRHREDPCTPFRAEDHLVRDRGGDIGLPQRGQNLVADEGLVLEALAGHHGIRDQHQELRLLGLLGLLLVGDDRELGTYSRDRDGMRVDRAADPAHPARPFRRLHRRGLHAPER